MRKIFSPDEEVKMQRKTARENAFILIFESLCKKEETAEEIFCKATEIRGLEYDDYVKNTFFGAYENYSVIEEQIVKSLMGWKKERVAPVTMAILTLATYEIMFNADIPEKVSINEAIELAKKYDDKKSYSFVNGVLNAISKEFSGK